MRNYTCHTCQEPMTVSLQFHWFIVGNGPQAQRCNNCGAVHTVHEHSVALATPGAMFAKLSAWFDFPYYKPYRVGVYRVTYQNGSVSKTLLAWNGEVWHNGPMVFQPGSIAFWQGLAGDMEHVKRMPYDFVMPIDINGSNHDEE